ALSRVGAHRPGRLPRGDRLQPGPPEPLAGATQAGPRGCLTGGRARPGGARPLPLLRAGRWQRPPPVEPWGGTPILPVSRSSSAPHSVFQHPARLLFKRVLAIVVDLQESVHPARDLLRRAAAV